MKKFLLLGYGYTAKAIEKILTTSIPEVEIYRTSRSGSPHISFDLKKPESWERLPSVDGTFWTFPAEDVASVEKLLEQYKHRLGKVVAIGSTRSFQIEKENDLVNEGTPLNKQLDRVRGENLIRENGGVVIYSAGIYGPGRNPVDWVRKGWVAPSPKLLNVIHVTDLARICIAALYKDRPGAIYIAADGRPHPWSELIDRWIAQYNIELPSEAKGSTRESKQVDPLFTLEELGVELKYPDIYIGVSELN